MEERLKDQLHLCISLYGLNDLRTIAASQMLDILISQSQKIYVYKEK